MANNKSLHQLEQAIAGAQSYQEFLQASLEHDRLSGADAWKAEDKSRDYDYKLIRKRVQRMKDARAGNDAPALMFILHEGIHGNLGNIANPDLTHSCKIGTKVLIQDFLNEVCAALDFIYAADEADIDFHEKLSFFEETSFAYGQSCLMLSGGAGLGFFHCGVVRSLLEHDLLPEVISGASAGSIIAALVATRTDAQLMEMLTAESIYQRFQKWSLWRGLKKGSWLDSTNLENALIELFDLMTFEDAYNLTGRKVTITVSAADLHQYSRLLNAKTSPNAVITQAVRASCAIPWVFDPVQLKARNQAGEIVPYIPSRRFADGSLMADMPFDRLARLYGVNHSIVSQTNPLAVPFLSRTKQHSKGLYALTKKHLVNLAKSNGVYAFDVMENLIPGKATKLGIHKLRSIIDQQYEGDINILPARSLGSLKHLLTNPTEEGLKELIRAGERATWPQLDLIERSTKISKTFNHYLKLLKQREIRILSGKEEKPGHKLANTGS
ncbi:DUF3336 domain-containing protein [Lacimicrobium alkaliphilum]|uniref:PNPLA domain-containing protein n=1 Tax=Lacimicrobium alkaliphilum TaxID=1526571 RepID=A0ABQ1RQI6_9ALTE|nr:DUF3336 domain-containing protein [Lacimicrobium alkaliphilum]GGD76097.1 hypothetical protein GCM10011357_33900 [Lacimicrobium alkaliphilum]